MIIASYIKTKKSEAPMTKKQLLMTILLVMAISMTGYSNLAYGALSTPTSFGTITVNSNDSLDLICNDPTFDAGESIEGREILIDNGPFGSPEVTIGGETDLIALICDGIAVNAIDFSSALYTDLADINIRLIVYDDAEIDSQADSTFEVADNISPTITGTGSTQTIELEAVNSFSLPTPIVSDNDPAYSEIVTVGGDVPDTSFVGVYTITFSAPNDASGNLATGGADVVITVEDTSIPTLVRNQANPQAILVNDAVPTLEVTVTDNDKSVNGDIIACNTASVDNTTVGGYTATCDFTDPSSNNAVQVTYTVNVSSGNAPIITDNNGDGSINFGSAFTHTGFLASDIEDGNVTSSITVDVRDPSGVTTLDDVVQSLIVIDSNISGIWEIEASVVDSNSNPASAITSITVGAEPIVKKKSGGSSNDAKARPTFNNNHRSLVDVVDCGFSHNGVCYEVTGYHTPFDKVEIPLEIPQTFTISADTSRWMKWMELCLVPAIGEMNEAEWCTEVYFESNGDLKEFKIISDEVLTNEDLIVTTMKNGTTFTASISNVKFVDIPYFEVIGIKAVDRNNKVEYAFMNDGFEFTGVPSIDNPIVSVHLPLEGKGLTELQRVDKINNIWETENGVQYTNYELSGWMRITPMEYERHTDSGELKNRNHNVFPSLIEWTQKNAVDVFDSSVIQGSDKGFKTVEYPNIDSRTQFLLDHDLTGLTRGY
jgi:hypothetical protein